MKQLQAHASPRNFVDHHMVELSVDEVEVHQVLQGEEVEDGEDNFVRELIHLRVCVCVFGLFVVVGSRCCCCFFAAADDAFF